MKDEILARIRDYLAFYEDFRDDLYLLMKKYEETENLRIEMNKIAGKIEVLKELEKIVEEMWK